MNTTTNNNDVTYLLIHHDDMMADYPNNPTPYHIVYEIQSQNSHNFQPYVQSPCTCGDNNEMLEDDDNEFISNLISEAKFIKCSDIHGLPPLSSFLTTQQTTSTRLRRKITPTLQ